MPQIEPHYGDQICKMRKAYGLTQIEFAEKAGIAVNSLRRYESNERQPNMKVIAKMASALNLSVDKFLWRDPISHRSYFWTAELEEKLKQVGCSIGFDEEDSYIWVNYPDGTLEVTEQELIELNESTNSFLRFKLNELKEKNSKCFRMKRDDNVPEKDNS